MVIQIINNNVDSNIKNIDGHCMMLHLQWTLLSTGGTTPQIRVVVWQV